MIKQPKGLGYDEGRLDTTVVYAQLDSPERRALYKPYKNKIMSNEEIEKVAFRVAEILGGNQSASLAEAGCSLGPAKSAINNKLIDEVVNECQNAIIRNLNSDEEQFIAVGQLRGRMASFWDDQMRTSQEVSSVNVNRSQALSKFIEMTEPR